MAEDNIRETALNGVDFIFRRPWLITCSFLLLFNAIQAYSETIPALYNTRAVLLFENAPGTNANKNTIAEKKAAIERTWTGTNIDTILEEVVKNKPDAERKITYENLRSKLINSKTGLQFNWSESGVGNVLSIYFEYAEAPDCYATVKAAMDMVISESEQALTRETSANLLFLNNQLKFYKGRLEEIDSETEVIKQNLANRYSELTGLERSRLSKLSNDEETLKTSGSEDKAEVVVDEATTLRADLANLKDRREKLQASLNDKTFIIQSILSDMDKGDLLAEENKKITAAKEMEIESLLSRGYKEKHPQVKQLRQEIDRTKELRQKRSMRTKSIGTDSPEYREAKEKVELEIQEIDLKIALIVNYTKNVDSNTPAVAEKKAATVKMSGTAKEDISKLSSLAEERTLNMSYYNDMRKNIASAELKYRTESQSAGFTVSVVQEPSLPIKPDSSRSRHAASRGLFFAILAALGIGYASFILKDSVHSDREIEDLLGIPVIATIDTIVTKTEMVAQSLRFIYAAIAVIVTLIISRLIIALAH